MSGQTILGHVRWDTKAQRAYFMPVEKGEWVEMTADEFSAKVGPDVAAMMMSPKGSDRWHTWATKAK